MQVCLMLAVFHILDLFGHKIPILLIMALMYVGYHILIPKLLWPVKVKWLFRFFIKLQIHHLFEIRQQDNIISQIYQLMTPNLSTIRDSSEDILILNVRNLLNYVHYYLNKTLINFCLSMSWHNLVIHYSQLEFHLLL